jgi:hypothetical protein
MRCINVTRGRRATCAPARGESNIVTLFSTTLCFGPLQRRHAQCASGLRNNDSCDPNGLGQTEGRNADWIGGIWVGSTIIAWLLCRWRGHSVVAWTLTIHSLLSWPLCRCREQPEGQCGHSRPALSLCDGVMSRFTDHLGRDRRMIAPDEPGEQRDGNADQRCADEKILKARTLDDEARGASKKASR